MNIFTQFFLQWKNYSDIFKVTLIIWVTRLREVNGTQLNVLEGAEVHSNATSTEG